MRAGLCVLSSDVCELTEIIYKEKVGYTFKPGNFEDLRDKILYLASHKEEAKRTGARGKEYGLSHFSFDKTTKELQEWALHPAFAPDKNQARKIFFDKDEAHKNMAGIVARQKNMIEDRDKRIAELEGMVSRSIPHKIYAYLKLVKRKIFK